VQCWKNGATSLAICEVVISSCEPLLARTLDCTTDESVGRQPELGAVSALDSTSCNFEAVKRMVETCNVQGTARFDGLKWT